MARTNQLNTKKPPEHMQVLNPSDPTDEGNVPVADLSNHDGIVKGSAVEAEDLERPSPPVARYLIKRGGMVQTQLNGPRSRLNAGKEIDANNYDIALLKRQGVELENIAPEFRLV